MKSKDRKLKELQKRLEVSCWVPTEGQADAAQERVVDMVTYFREFARGMDFMQSWDALELLARSCYLQGVWDAGQIMARRDGSLLRKVD